MIQAAAYLAPIVLIFWLLSRGRYPGERALVAVARRARPRVRPAPNKSGRRGATVWLPRGGALVGAALAGRAPPQLLVLTRPCGA